MSEYGDLKTHMLMWSINVTHKLKKTVFCAISSQKVYGPFFFAEETVTDTICLETLQLWLMPQLQNIPTFIFQLDEVPPTSTVRFVTT
jgi:hypothetical protein